MRPKAVGISGGSCSGKTTLTHKIFQRLGPDQCVILPQDDYFFGLGDAPEGKGGPNFDHPHAVDFDQLRDQLAQLKNGQAIDRPLYDFPTHMPKAETERTEPRPVILIDGILILQHQPLRELLDLSIFVECDSETRFARRLKRDVRERGRTPQSVHEQFANQVGPMHDLHVEPSKNHADIVINSQQCESAFDDLFRIVMSRI
ncbi:MAG: uridine kinase [Sphingomonadales bacterium]|nr:uridine kinase [Sphingomonadales bacterium]PIX66389.1 MAG: uridine kinase [Sphingomonadales bacterium CG_4_10_14_3_um_filter_58_15]NCO99815.1 uridine kinase [Sphingomonadales bacterium]NCP28133.1 uridine kinase [Sphingomonadales bacterium]NCP42365.1 uridine kinase [Sphingomonadales bacterium]